MPKNLTKPFILILLLLLFIGCYVIFRPFLTEILVAAILVTVFYVPYQWLLKSLKGRRNLASLLMCLFLVIIVILPTVKLIAYAADKSVTAYNDTVQFFNTHNLEDVMETNTYQHSILKNIDIFHLRVQDENIEKAILSIFKKSSNWLLSGATIVVKETTNFIISLGIIILAMFFFFVDGENILRRLMYLSPLPNKYDVEIFNKFRSISYTTFISTFITAAAQGVIGAIGFAIVGFPPFLAGILVALLSLVPYVGSTIFYVPVGLFYLLMGNIWQGIFILLWGFLIIGSIDNIIRTYLIKGKADVNPVFILFSILGGITVFGFWGLILGPLVVALTVSILRIYELEFCDSLDECDPIAKEKNNY